MQLRYDRPRLAHSVEHAVTAGLSTKILLREAAQSCTDATHKMPGNFEISAMIDIQGRDIAVQGWGCNTDTNEAAAGKICDCIVGQFPEFLSAAVPSSITDRELTIYEGMLILRL
jgi:hypothetical protein